MKLVLRRREAILGASCVLGLGLAEALRPRRQVSLLGTRKLGDVIPAKFGRWTSLDTSDLVAPREQNSLASRIYGQTVGRIYVDAATQFQVMMLAAHGETQSRDLQLHRPEVCYPAVGFSVSGSHPEIVHLPHGAQLPIRQLVADAPQRRESIAYWARVGEYFPVGGGEQRLDVLRMAMSGVIMDGVLMRFSSLGPTPEDTFPKLRGFISELIQATAPDNRAALVGSGAAKTMSA